MPDTHPMTNENTAADPAIIYPEPCADPVEFQVDGCRDSAVITAPATELLSLGRIVQVDAIVRHVCPGKRVAVAVVLSEVDGTGAEQNRGMKTVLIPAQTGEGCRDVELRCLNFVVPEALSGGEGTLCAQRSFRARVLANYVDTDYVCCDAQAAIV